MRVVVSLGATALVPVGIYALEPVAPVLSLGVLYLFAVLPVAALWGLRYAVPVSIVSMLAFNWFFLPPTHTFQLRDSENWVALAVYLVTAVSVSALATRQRQLAREDAAKTAVLRSVSPDLRSPITAILTASEVARGRRVDGGAGRVARFDPPAGAPARPARRKPARPLPAPGGGGGGPPPRGWRRA